MEPSARRTRKKRAPADAKRYRQSGFGPMQGTAPVLAMANSWMQCASGAQGPHHDVQRSCATMDVPIGELTVEKGRVLSHAASTARPLSASLVSRGDLRYRTRRRSKIPLPSTIGTKAARRSIVAAKCDGTAQYLGCGVARNASGAAQAPRDSKAAVKVPSTPRAALAVPGVTKGASARRLWAVVAKNFWAANAAAMRCRWNGMTTRREARQRRVMMARNYRQTAPNSRRSPPPQGTRCAQSPNRPQSV